MLGGGTFLVQNKTLPGAYINFISVAKANANLSDRGYASMPLELDWGISDEIFEVTNEDFQKNSLKLFGYDYTHEKLKGLRDLFLNLNTLYAYRLNGSGDKARNQFATAKYAGVRGNDLTLTIAKNIDDETKFDVALYLASGQKLDIQTVSEIAELVDNDFVIWDKDQTLAETAGMPLAGGTNSDVTGASHQQYLDKVENFSFNVLGVVTTDDSIKQLYAGFTKRMRDEIGAKFQLVIHNYKADYEGVIDVKNEVTDEGESPASLIYWITGIEASVEVNKSCLNRKYDGEYQVNASFTQKELENTIKNGEFTLHNVGTDVRVLMDVNSLVTTSDTKGDIFKENQTIRVCDQIANDIANIFTTKYLGVVPNDKSGRVSLWSDIVKHHEQLNDIRAIENFTGEDVTVEQGDTKNSVLVTDNISVINAMAKLYMTVKVG